MSTHEPVSYQTDPALTATGAFKWTDLWPPCGPSLMKTVACDPATNSSSTATTWVGH